jgi:predicted AAA+ superfamily ATPase
LFLELSRNPDTLEAMIGNQPKDFWVVIDEIQKIPTLLDEVHRLMETKGWRFALCGSSARKLRRGGVNLLGGRAITRNLDAFSFKELGDAFDTEFSLQWGFLPYVQLDRKNAADILNSYVNTYIKEEIREEGIVRSLPPFLRFLSIAGQLNGQLINGQNISREAGVPRSSVDVYFSILDDTLLGHFLRAYRPNVKVREQTHPKFYWFDPGVAMAAAGLLFEPVDRLWKGTALENMIYHELTQIMQHKARRYCYDIIFNICNTICVIDPFFR